MKFYIISILCFLINTLAFSQLDKEISYVRIKESNSSLGIIYDAKGINKGDSLKIEVKSKASPNIIYPKSLTGDFGENISSGKDKTISWDMKQDSFLINDSIQVSLSIIYYKEKKVVSQVNSIESKANLQKKNLGYLSILVPGLGSYLVSDKKKVPLRIATAGVVYGLAAGAYFSKKLSNDLYKTYLTFNKEVDAQPYYNDANLNNHIYYVTAILGGAIWVTDIVSAINKGKKIRLQSGTKVSIKLDQVQSVPTIGLNYQF